jgi:oligo-1,6-glucosidase
VLKEVRSSRQARPWWKEAIVYEIYPRSFYDSNEDGIGDLKGITQKLDYLKDLGIDVLWLCPIYKSPNVDYGYDVADYYEIGAEYGIMDDFKELLGQAHKRGLKVVMDLVVNHTSDEHPWFVASKSSKDNDKRDYYIWRKGCCGREPNNWASYFTPSAWTYDPKTNEYYLHLFSEKQPDLNWENPKLRNDIYEMMKWWLDQGIDGFRMDVINCISKHKDLPNVPGEGNGCKFAGQYFLNGPEVNNYLREMNECVLSKYDIMTVGETLNVTPDDAILYTADARHELNMIFPSELMEIDGFTSGSWRLKKWTLSEFKQIIVKWQTALHGKGWTGVFLGNHDYPRIVSRFGDDKTYRVESAKLLATLLLTLEGTPFIFQGEEIGMTNVSFNSIDDYRDTATLNLYREYSRKAIAIIKPLIHFYLMYAIHKLGRDNARTPMQWNTSPNAGFTTGEPWIKINPNYTEINVEKDESDEDSILNYYTRMIKVRKANPVLIYGKYIPLFEKHKTVFAYLREFENQKCLVLLNFSGESSIIDLPDDLRKSNRQLLIKNLKEGPCEANGRIKLRPYEALVYQL